MCYSSGSIDQAVNPCPMCMVYKHLKCPHIRKTCTNRAAHPRMDVLYLTNAEVECFNGCGFCKWAEIGPPSKTKGYANPGWPGCCRAPTPHEYPMIQVAEWKAVNIVHNVPIPPDIERLLESLNLRFPSTRVAGAMHTSPSSRSALSKPSTPSRKTSAATTPTKLTVASSGKPSNTQTPHRGRSPIVSTPASPNIPRNPSSTAISSSVPNSSSVDSVARRKTAAGTPDRRNEGTQSSNSSPSRKALDIEDVISSPQRSPSMRRPVLTPATTSVSVSKVVAADSRSPRESPLKRRSSISTSAEPPVIPEPPRKEAIPPLRQSRDALSSASSNSGSSDGMGSISDSTVTSDGGFTDYLSDESEAELQRQAEARAVVLAQNQVEELEFKMARQQLANVGLKPPKSWNPSATPPRAVPAPSNARNGMMSPTSSFAGAASALMQSGQARD